MREKVRIAKLLFVVVLLVIWGVVFGLDSFVWTPKTILTIVLALAALIFSIPKLFRKQADLCPHCGNPLPQSGEYCPHCGSKLS